MSNYVDPISKSLNAATPIAPPTPVVKEHTEEADFMSKVQAFRNQMATNATLDYKDARHNIRLLIQGAMDAFPDVVGAVEETRSDKAIIALNGFLKTVTEMNQLLVSLNSSVTKEQRTTQQPNIQAQTANVVIQADTSDAYQAAVESPKDRFNIDHDDD